jgi:hypothetical protein
VHAGAGNGKETVFVNINNTVRVSQALEVLKRRQTTIPIFARDLSLTQVRTSSDREYQLRFVGGHWTG